MIKLTNLNPNFFSASGAMGAGIFFDCPCGCNQRRHVAFSNPIHGENNLSKDRPVWKRTGDKFESMTLTPSIHIVKEKGGCGWHGYLTDGEFKSC